MRVTVTGGAGYIGSVMTLLLLDAGHEVTVFDNLCLGHRAAVPDGARLLTGDLHDAEVLAEIIGQTRPDCIMHFAALSLVAESVEKPDLYFDNNVTCGLNLLNAVARHRVPRFVFSSSAAVYGVPRRVPITEDSRLEPTNPYGSTKLAFEVLLREFARTHRFHFASLRYFNAAGAHRGLGEDHRPETHLIPAILKSVLNPGQGFTIFGDDYDTRDGTCVRDYIHVYDLCHAHLLAMEATGDRDVVYNLGSGQGFTVKEVFETAQKVVGSQLNCKVTDRRAGDPPELVASSAKIESELGWKPEKPDLATMIADAWEWHQAHPDGYAD